MKWILELDYIFFQVKILQSPIPNSTVSLNIAVFINFPRYVPWTNCSLLPVNDVAAPLRRLRSRALDAAAWERVRSELIRFKTWGKFKCLLVPPSKDGLFLLGGCSVNGAHDLPDHPPKFQPNWPADSWVIFHYTAVTLQLYKYRDLIYY